MKKQIKEKIKIGRKLLGITANVKNLLIAIALLFAFLGGFFQVYSWIDSTYTRVKDFKIVKAKQDFTWENDILKGMYSRYYVLDNIVKLSPDPKSVPETLKKEYDGLAKEIELQVDKVKVLQKNLCN
jgi:hypothetical protein